MAADTETNRTPEPLRSEVLKIVAIYSMVGGLWIYLSDAFMGLLIRDPAVMSRLSIYKGLVFIVFTASLLYLLISRYARRIGIHMTELNQAQHLLNRQKELLDTVVEGTTDAVYIKDVAGHYLLANTAVANFVKKPIEEIVGYNDAHLFSPVQAKALMAQDQWVMAQDAPQTYEENITTPDGELCFLSTKGAMRDENGVVTGIFGVARDISERKQVEADLRKSEEKFYKAFNASPEAIAIITLDGGIYVDVNEVFCAITGFTRDEVIGHTSDELGLWIDLSERRHFIDELSKNGSIKSHDVRYRMKNREERNFLVSSEVIEIAGKRCGLNFIMDITERKLAENAVKESEFFFKESQRAANVGSYKADFTTYHWKPSEVLSNIFGIDENYDCSVQGWIDIIHPDDRDMMDEYLRVEVISKGRPFSKEYRIIRQTDGETRWVNGLGEATFDSNGNILTLCGTVQDITERKLVEEERQDLEKQLLQSQKMESLGVLAGGIAHDFNNILTVIMGRCSLAKFEPERAAENIPLIEKAAERAAELCRQMLAYAGKAQYVKKEVNVGDLVDEMVNMLKTTINRNVVIIHDRPADVSIITGDASQIRQIVMNLIINASDAIGEAHGEILVSLANTVIRAGQLFKDHLGKAISPGNYVCLEVTDNGCGMDEETKQRIFEPFYSTKFAGRGLGMSATLGIISAHQGALQLSSQLSKGTTIKVYLPLQVSGPSEDHSYKQAALSMPWQYDGTILLVEDEGQIKLVAKAMLEELGFTVIEASDGKEALELYQKNSEGITLVLTDIGMPLMDGYELIRELKIINPDLPIIVSSGFGDTVVTSRIAQENIAGLISKPYRFDRLQDVLRGVVESMKLKQL